MRYVPRILTLPVPMPRQDMCFRSPLDIIHHCFRACYENPIFHEEDGKGNPQQNGPEKPGKPTDCNGVDVGDGRHKQNDTSPARRKLSDDVTCTGHRKRKRRCQVASVLVFIVAFIVPVVLLVYFLKEDEFSNKDTQSLPVINISQIEVNLTLADGPFSHYEQDYTVFESEASRTLRRVFVYKVSKVFSSSDLAYIYNATEVVRIRNVNDKVSMTINIRVPHQATCPSNCDDLIASTLISGLSVKGSLFIVDPKTISVHILIVPPITPAPEPAECLPIAWGKCAKLSASGFWVGPNILGHRTNQEVSTYLTENPGLLDNACYGYDAEFFCAAFYPECPSTTRLIPTLPCRQFCKDVMVTCQDYYIENNVTVPFKCMKLPNPIDDDSNICKPSPFIAGKCLPSPIRKCRSIGFNFTSYPNALGSVRIDSTSKEFFESVTILQIATHCFKHSLFFACSVISPPCRGKDPPNHYIPPCRSLCQKHKDRCEIFLNVFHKEWPAEVNCSSLPESLDPTVCTGYGEALEADDKVCLDNQWQCGGDELVCLEKKWLCDGVQDCHDNSDEEHCASCGAGKTECSTNSALCIEKAQVCDGTSDCYEETDEMYCVRLDGDSGSHLNTLQVYNAASSDWEEVCKDGWTPDLSHKACQQLGYSQALAAYYTRQSIKRPMSTVSPLRNGSDPQRLQSYLTKGQGFCLSNYVVKLLCWKAVCGVRPAHVFSPLRVVGGNEVSPGTWPWMVSLHGGSSQAFFCGGTIIGDEWVLTAAHCVGGATQETNYWTIMTGNTRRDVYSKYRQVRKPKRFFLHNFNFETAENDIALIQLERPFIMNDYVRAVCLPERATPPGTRCFVTGWGKASVKSADYQTSMKEVRLDVTPWEFCYHALRNSDIAAPYDLKESMLCAGGASGHDGCQGDSGGPLVCRKDDMSDQWYQSGVVSWGIICGRPNVPGVYTNITYYSDWIRETIANNTQNMDDWYTDIEDSIIHWYPNTTYTHTVG